MQKMSAELYILIWNNLQDTWLKKKSRDMCAGKKNIGGDCVHTHTFVLRQEYSCTGKSVWGIDDKRKCFMICPFKMIG